MDIKISQHTFIAYFYAPIYELFEKELIYFSNVDVMFVQSECADQYSSRS